jgi:hypothetical protein
VNQRKTWVAGLMVILCVLFGAASCNGATTGGSDSHPSKVIEKKHIKRGIDWVNGPGLDCKTWNGKCWHSEAHLECWQLTLSSDNPFSKKDIVRVKCVSPERYRANEVGKNYRP